MSILPSVKQSLKSQNLTQTVYGPELKEMKLAILSCGNDVAMEIFQFVDPPYSGPTTRVDWNPDTYTRGGVFHFCLTVPDVETTVAEAVTAGARRVGGMIEPLPGHKACYLQDPWGNTLELLSCTINQLYLAMIGSALQGKE